MAFLNSYQRREARLYLRWALTQRQGVRSLGAMAVALARKPLVRLGRQLGPPPYLKEAPMAPASSDELRRGADADGQERFRGNGRVGIHLAEGHHGREEILTIPLATGDFRVSAVRGWELEAEDPEDAYALHRFGWVLRTLAENPNRQLAAAALAMILDWVRNGPKDISHLAWQSYNVSERIVHWLLFLLLLRGSGQISDADEMVILESVVRQADHVLGHLEYHGPDRTNNHLLNNGRALYIAGALLRTVRHAEAGRMILSEESSTRFSPPGFLAEGSSHYHLLLSRTLLEMLWVAETVGDRTLCDALAKPVARAVRCAGFFFPRRDGTLPLFGDVSPDFPPEWFTGIPDIASRWAVGEGGIPGSGQPGWHSLWGGAPTDVPLSLHGLVEPFSDALPGFLAYRDAGWYRCVMARYVMFWHAEAPASPIGSCHAHHDVGSFELHVENRQMVVDPGRVTYRSSPLGYEGRSARAHNAILVDGWEPWVTPCFNGHEMMLDSYCKRNLEVAWAEGGGVMELGIHHDGFQRVPRLGRWSRRFLLSVDGVRLVDRLEGEGSHTIESFFHFHPDLDVWLDAAGGKAILSAPGVSLQLHYACEELTSVNMSRMGTFEDGVPAGWFSPRYGVAVPAWTIRFRQVVRLPAESVFEFRLG